MAKKYVLYEHQNKINGKRYIGITNDTVKRWYGKGKHYENCTYFFSAIKKYGWDNFTHRILLSDLTIELANLLEIRFIEKFRTCEKEYGYNLAKGGNHAPTMLGKHHSEETKQKMRKAMLGKKHSKEQNKRHSEYMTGLMVGKKNHKSRPVRCINTGEVFESQRLAAKAKEVLQPKIWKCCNGQATHVHGLRWEYVEATEV